MHLFIPTQKLKDNDLSLQMQMVFFSYVCVWGGEISAFLIFTALPLGNEKDLH